MCKASTGACPPETKSSFSVQYCSVCFIFSFVVFCRQIFVALRVGDEYFPQTIPSRLSVVFTPQLASYPSCGSQPSSTGPHSGTCVLRLVSEAVLMEELRIKLSQLSTKLKLKLELSLAIYSTEPLLVPSSLQRENN